MSTEEKKKEPNLLQCNFHVPAIFIRFLFGHFLLYQKGIIG